MLLSLSIPTYNRSKLIIETIQNLVYEIDTFNLYELCRIDVFDNNSNDDTIKVCNSILTKTKVKYKINNVNEKRGSLDCFVTDLPRQFEKLGRIFLGESINEPQLVDGF